MAVKGSVKKQLGCTWIEVNNEVQTFVVDDQGPQMIEICAELKRLSGLMHDAGYAPYTRFVLHDLEEEEKVSHLRHHRETGCCIQAHQYSSWYSTPNNKKSAGL
jgi:hypothetical protein